MSKKMRTLRCPKCKYPFLLNGQPDALHPYASTEKPREVDGDIKEEIYDCHNEKCRNPITVYWYNPKRVFNRV